MTIKKNVMTFLKLSTTIPPRLEREPRW